MHRIIEFNSFVDFDKLFIDSPSISIDHFVYYINNSKNHLKYLKKIRKILSIVQVTY